ncbi:MAG: oxygen-independent coproporphyrinogen III oxidase-like protein [Betaproteobacteria bacterium]|nr:oxygen-independent coproporphyrinogen III oxidase-like protein [Betaproteobacteria bacterium]
MPASSQAALGVMPGRIALTALPPLSLYIHIPWCVRKCPYCDFNSHEGKGAIPERQYIDALISDLDYTLPKIWGRRVYSVFFGGGTPSLFSAEAIDGILAAVRARLSLDSDAEITLEANPGTFEAEKFRGFRAAGVNRLSIGIQSFNENHLKALGRIHNSDEARRAIQIAQENFDNINLDLMFALPNQTLAECERDIETALSFNTHHLSIYHLTLEPNTLFHAFPPPLPDDDLAADMLDMVRQKLAAAGYVNYETSAYAKPTRESDSRSRHNMNYWRFGDYIGIGAGAHGKISFPDRITREARYKQPQAFMERAVLGDAIQEGKTISAAELPFEFMLNALRLTEGFTLAMFVERTGLPVTAISSTLDAAEAKGLIARDHIAVKPTDKGRLFLNDLLEMFLPT